MVWCVGGGPLGRGERPLSRGAGNSPVEIERPRGARPPGPRAFAPRLGARPSRFPGAQALRAEPPAEPPSPPAPAAADASPGLGEPSRVPLVMPLVHAPAASLTSVGDASAIAAARDADDGSCCCLFCRC